jgi:hypothetical protein
VIHVHQHRGLEEEALGVGVAPPAGQHACAVRHRVGHVALHDLELGGLDHRADVRLALGPLAQLRRLLDHLAHELVGHAVRHVDALGGDAHLAGVGEGSVDRAGGRALEVRVLAHQHRVLAAELEGAGHELPAAGFGHAASGRDAAGEGDLVAARLDQGASGLAVSEQTLEDALGKTCTAQQLLDELAREGRDLGGLQEHRVARHQGLGGRIQREQEREVPRRDDAHHAERPVRDAELLALHQVHRNGAVGEDALGALGVEGERVAGSQHLDGEGLGLGLARLASQHHHELVLAL